MMRLIPRTLFGRIASILCVAVLASHLLAVLLLFELHVPMSSAFPSPTSVEPSNGRESSALWLYLGVRVGLLVLVSWASARWLSVTFRKLAKASQEFGQSIDLPPLRIGGAQEFVEASRAFNQMQLRIRQKLSERDRLFGVVSHDLRTPMTRLRLRLELIQDAVVASGIRQDLLEMDVQLSSTLDYLRSIEIPETPVSTDVESLVSGLVDDEVNKGNSITMDGHAQPLLAQPRALRRCLDCLLSTSIRNGSQAHVSLIDHVDKVVISVQDNGPDAQFSDLMNMKGLSKNLGQARASLRMGGSLGVVIANNIAYHHGGSLTLETAPRGGLVARLILPRRMQGT